jgi:hypothetical protein
VYATQFTQRHVALGMQLRHLRGPTWVIRLNPSEASKPRADFKGALNVRLRMHEGMNDAGQAEEARQQHVNHQHLQLAQTRRAEL